MKKYKRYIDGVIQNFGKRNFGCRTYKEGWIVEKKPPVKGKNNK